MRVLNEALNVATAQSKQVTGMITGTLLKRPWTPPPGNTIGGLVGAGVVGIPVVGDGVGSVLGDGEGTGVGAGDGCNVGVVD